jgi:hypothetical protein
LNDEIKTLKEENEKLSDPQRLQDSINARVELIDSAKMLFPGIETAEKTDREIRIDTLKKVSGLEFSDSDSDEYIKGMFQGFRKQKTKNADDKQKTRNAFKDSNGDNNSADKDPVKEARNGLIARNQKGDK